MKHLLLAFLLIPTLAFGQANRDVQKKASRQTANVETLTGNKTLTYLDAETQLLTPSGADRTVTLPSTNVWKAWTVKIVNEDASNKLVIKSSDGDTLDTLAAVGKVEYVARQAIPTDTLHWTNVSKIGTLGVTDGSSACVGCVGEVLSAPITNVTAYYNGAAQAAATLPPLSKGHYLFLASGTGNLNPSSVANSLAMANVVIRDVTEGVNIASSGMIGSFWGVGSAQANSNTDAPYPPFGLTGVKKITQDNTTVQLQISCISGSGAPASASFGSTATGSLYAIRIR